MTSRKLTSRTVVSASDSPASESNVKLKQTKISNWLNSRSNQNCEEDSSDSEISIQSCSKSSSDSLSEEEETTIVLQLDGILTCDVLNCNYQTSFKADLEKHKKFKHKLKPLKCQECDFATSYKNAFTYHMRVHAGNLPMKCRLCGWATITRSSLKFHMKQIHETAERRKQGITRASVFGKRFKCSKCDFRAVSKQEIHFHNYSHETERKYKCSFPGCDYRSKMAGTLRDHVKRHDVGAKKSFQCSLCPKLFWTKYVLHAHIRTHTKEQAVPCSVCDFVSSNAGNLRIHMRKHAKKSEIATAKHNAGKSTGALSNNESQQSSGTGSSLQPEPNGDGNTVEAGGTTSRLQPKTKSVKRGTKFLEETAATTKKSKKVREKKLKCDHCDFTDIVKSRIKRHAVVHRDPDDKLYSCSFPGCNFKTNWEDYVKKHKRDMHKSTPDHVCPIEGCGFQTKWKDTFAQHKRIHEKKRKKDHQCPMCRKAFYDRQGLRRHINIHTQEKKYKCPLCDYISAEGSNFYAHRRKYHPGQECEPIKVM